MSSVFLIEVEFQEREVGALFNKELKEVIVRRKAYEVLDAAMKHNQMVGY